MSIKITIFSVCDELWLFLGPVKKRTPTQGHYWAVLGAESGSECLSMRVWYIAQTCAYWPFLGCAPYTAVTAGLKIELNTV